MDTDALRRILIIDTDVTMRDILSAFLQEEGYTCVLASDVAAALVQVVKEPISLTISGTPMSGAEVATLREKRPDMAVILLTGFGDTEQAVDCLRRGASDYLLKPPRLADLVHAVKRALAKRHTELLRKRYQKKLEHKVRVRTAELRTALEDIAAAYQNTLTALVSALDAREHEAGNHSLRVVEYTVAVADRMGVTGTVRDEIARGALLHDIGKIGVLDAVLRKPGKLTSEEWVEMRRHPEVGYRMISSIPFLQVPAQIVLAHHERFDGQGYPRKLQGYAVPLGARIFAVADTLDAMTSDRPYRRGASFANALVEVQRCSGSQFDPEVVRAFLEVGEVALVSIHARMTTCSGQAVGDPASCVRLYS